MNVYLKLYKLYDADMYAIKNAGISISGLMKLALAYRVRGKKLHVHIPAFLPYDLFGKKRCIPMQIAITDPLSIKFLLNGIKPMQRTAFLKMLLRDCLLDQVAGAYIKDERMILEESGRLALADYGTCPDLLICRPGDSRHSYYPMVKNRTLDLGDVEGMADDADKAAEKSRKRKRGNIDDLAPVTGLVLKTKEENERKEWKEAPPALQRKEAEADDESLFEEVYDAADDPSPQDEAAAVPAESTAINDAAKGSAKDAEAVPYEDEDDAPEEMTDEEAEIDIFSQFDSL